MPAPENLVHETSTTTGTGNLTVTSVNGKQSFSDAFGTGGSDVFDYFVSNQGGTEWERGTGSMSDATTLVRDTVIESTNSNNAVDFSAGTKDVTNDIPAGNQIRNEGSTVTDGHLAAFSGTTGRLITSGGSKVVSAIDAGAVSSQAMLDLDLSGGADMYEIDLVNCVPVTDGAILYLRFSQSSTFLSGAADYSWGGIRSGTPAADASDDHIEVTGGTGSGTNEGLTLSFRLFRPAASSFYKTITYFGIQHNSGVNSFRNAQGGGQMIANANAIDGIRFYWSSGNISSAYYVVRSYSFT